MESDTHLAELAVDLGAIAHNVRHLAAAAAPADVMAVVKADGYNHGLAAVVDTVTTAGAKHIGVATIGEALAVRATGEVGAKVPLTAWMWFPAQSLSAALAADVTIGIPSLAHARSLIDQARAQGHPASAFLMVDTGLSRSGVSPAEWEDTVALLAAHQDTVDVRGLMSHLASADAPDELRATTDVQAERFQHAIEFCRARGLAVPCNHIANTPGTLTREDIKHELVRPGVGVYGVDPVLPATGVDLRPAMTFRARVTTTRVVPAGEGVSYGLTWRADVDTRTAVVAVGYADGIPRSASGRFEVAIDGRRYPQVGRVCMDQVVISLGPASDPDPGVRPGDWATIFGPGGPSIDEFAAAAGTIPYEILTLPRGPRVRRLFYDATSDPAPSPCQGVPGVPAPGVDLEAERGAVEVHDPEAMRELGVSVGEQLLRFDDRGAAGTVVVLTGPLGAGKTTLTQGIARGLGVKGRVQSPTFTIVRTHPSAGDGPGMLHMDAYRLLGDTDAESLSREAVLDTLEALDLDADIDHSVVVAEWGRGVVEFLSDRVLELEISRPSAEADEVRTVAWRWAKGSV